MKEICPQCYALVNRIFTKRGVLTYECEKGCQGEVENLNGGEVLSTSSSQSAGKDKGAIPLSPALGSDCKALDVSYREGWEKCPSNDDQKCHLAGLEAVARTAVDQFREQIVKEVADVQRILYTCEIEKLRAAIADSEVKRERLVEAAKIACYGMEYNIPRFKALYDAIKDSTQGAKS